MESVATVVQQQLAEIGVTVNIESCDTSTFFPRFFASKDKELATTWDLGTNGWDSQRGSNCGQAISYLQIVSVIVDTVMKFQACSESHRNCRCERKTGTLEYNSGQSVGRMLGIPTYIYNFVMVSQKNVTGLDGSSVVPEFIDYLSIHMD